MIKTYCDRCEREDIGIYLTHFKIDGVNWKTHDFDLCYKCEQNLRSMFTKWLAKKKLVWVKE